MRRAPKGVYPPSGPYGGLVRDMAFVATGEYREPVKGDWYLSGAIIEAYLSPARLDGPMWIARQVRLVKCATCNGHGKLTECGRKDLDRLDRLTIRR